MQIWVDIEEDRVKSTDCILAMTDNTSAMGWLRRTNFREERGGDKENDNDWLVKQQVAQKLAEILMDAQVCLYSQWFAGSDNVGSDSLSRDCAFLSHSSHENFLSIFAQNQIPLNFSIRPLPKKIVSFASSILAQLPVKKQRLKVQKPSDLLLGIAGSRLSSPLVLNQEFSSMEYLNSIKTSSCQHLHKESEKPSTLNQVKKIWFSEQLKPPCHLYLRPSGQTLGLTPDWTKMVRLASSYKNNTVDIKIKTATRKSKKRSLHQCSE